MPFGSWNDAFDHGHVKKTSQMSWQGSQKSKFVVSCDFLLKKSFKEKPKKNQNNCVRKPPWNFSYMFQPSFSEIQLNIYKQTKKTSRIVHQIFIEPTCIQKSQNIAAKNLLNKFIAFSTVILRFDKAWLKFRFTAWNPFSEKFGFLSWNPIIIRFNYNFFPLLIINWIFCGNFYIFFFAPTSQKTSRLTFNKLNNYWAEKFNFLYQLNH